MRRSLRVVLFGSAAGIVAFAFWAVTWELTEWQGRDPAPIPAGERFLQEWGRRLDHSGLYRFPQPPGKRARALDREEKARRLQRFEQGPVVSLLVYHRDGFSPVDPAPYLRALFLHLGAGCLLAWLLTFLEGSRSGFGTRWRFVAVMGAVVALLGPGFSGNWWGFPAGYVLARMGVTWLAWCAAGLILARVLPGSRAR